MRQRGRLSLHEPSGLRIHHRLSSSVLQCPDRISLLRAWVQALGGDRRSGSRIDSSWQKYDGLKRIQNQPIWRMTTMNAKAEHTIPAKSIRECFQGADVAVAKPYCLRGERLPISTVFDIMIAFEKADIPCPLLCGVRRGYPHWGAS